MTLAGKSGAAARYQLHRIPLGFIDDSGDQAGSVVEWETGWQDAFYLAAARKSRYADQMTNLIAYVLAAMLSWVSVSSLAISGRETEDQVRTRCLSIATDIVAVALDENEPPVFARQDGRIKTALLHASIGSLEGGFQRFVDDGSCNRLDFVADARGNCDGRTAFSTWQIHVVSNGYLLLSDGTLGGVMYTPDVAKAHPEWVVLGQDMIRDRKLAVRVAQRLERASLKAHGSLCTYSGEPCEDGLHPKADHRLQRAVSYYRAHPFVTQTAPADDSVSANTQASTTTAASD
jgi:hypothetical protein